MIPGEILKNTSWINTYTAKVCTSVLMCGFSFTLFSVCLYGSALHGSLLTLHKGDAWETQGDVMTGWDKREDLEAPESLTPQQAGDDVFAGERSTSAFPLCWARLGLDLIWKQTVLLQWQAQSLGCEHSHKRSLFLCILRINREGSELCCYTVL